MSYRFLFRFLACCPSELINACCPSELINATASNGFTEPMSCFFSFSVTGFTEPMSFSFFRFLSVVSVPWRNDTLLLLTDPEFSGAVYRVFMGGFFSVPWRNDTLFLTDPESVP